MIKVKYGYKIDAFQLTDYMKDYFKYLVIVMWKRTTKKMTIPVMTGLS